MQSPYKLASALAAIALLSVALSFAVGQSSAPATSEGSRYSVQYSAAQPRPLYFITDNATKTLHLYENGPRGCLLKQSIDLSQVGQVELIATTPDRLAGENSVIRTKQR